MAVSPVFPATLAMGATDTSRIGKQPCERLVADETYGTDSFPAKSGGSDYPSSNRCVVGSWYFFALRCVVGSQL